MSFALRPCLFKRSRSYPKLLLKTFVKIRQAAKAYAIGDLRHVVAILRQQFRRTLQPDGPQKLARRLTGQCLDLSVKMHGAEAGFTAEFLNGKMLVIHVDFYDRQDLD